LFLNDARRGENNRVSIVNDNKPWRSGIDVMMIIDGTQCRIPDVLMAHHRMICGNATVINVANCFQFNSRRGSNASFSTSS
jgi:hypothetical protein